MENAAGETGKCTHICLFLQKDTRKAELETNKTDFPPGVGRADLPDTFHIVSPSGTMLMFCILKNNKSNKNGRKICQWSAISNVTPYISKE